MGRWTKVGKASITAAKGGRRLQQAAREADAAPEAEAPAPEVDTRPTPQQAWLLIRYIAGKLVLARLEFLFLLKYVLIALGAALVALGIAQGPGEILIPTGVLLFGLFLLAAGVQWLVTRTISRLGAFDRLAGLDSLAGQATTAWWPNLKRELRRVGQPARPWTLLKLGAKYARRRASPDEQAALAGIDWRAVVPRDQWRQARQILAPSPKT